MRPMPELQIVELPTSELVEYSRNSKLHPHEQVDQIAESIRQFGNNDPIAVWHNEQGEPEIVEGHGRLMALRKLGIKTAPVIFLDHLTDEQRRAYALVHNKLTMNSDFDFEILTDELAALDSFDMRDFGFELESQGEEIEQLEVDQDEVPKLAEPRVLEGQIWQLGDHRLACGDSTDPAVVDALMGGETVDLLLTDPPYGISYVGGTEDALTIDNDNLTGNALRKLIADSMLAAKPSMREGAAFYVWFATASTEEFYGAMSDAGMKIRQQLFWVKNHFTLGRQDYQHKVEPCLYGWLEGGHWFAPTRSEADVLDDMADYQKMTKSELIAEIERIRDGGFETDALRADKPLRNGEHPTMKPVIIFARLIRNSSVPGQSVLDPFAGSGTTAIACEQMGRKAYMVELFEPYCDVIVERWERFTGKRAVLLNG